MNIKVKVDLESMPLKKLWTLNKSVNFLKLLREVLHYGEWDKYCLKRVPLITNSVQPFYQVSKCQKMCENCKTLYLLQFLSLFLFLYFSKISVYLQSSQIGQTGETEKMVDICVIAPVRDVMKTWPRWQSTKLNAMVQIWKN